MRLELLHELPSDEEFRQQWNALVLSMEQPEVFYTWEWAQAMCAAYGSRTVLRLFAGYCEDKLVGIAALASQPNCSERVSFLCAATADYCDFVSRPRDREEFIRAVFTRLRQEHSSFVDLASVPGDSLSAKFVPTAARDAGLHAFSRPAYDCSQVVFCSEQDRLDAARSAARQRKRKLNALSAHGPVALQHSSSWQDSAAEFPAFVRAHVGRFLANARLSNLVSRERRNFLQELGKRLAEPGWLSISTVRVDDKAVAWNFGANFAGKWFWYQPAFETRLQDAGPGTCLITDIIAKASQDTRINTVDLGLGDEAYKSRYANSARATLNFVVARSRAACVREKVRYRAATFVKRSDAFEKSVRAFLARAAVIRDPARLKQAVLRMGTTLFGRTEIIFFEYLRTLEMDRASETGQLQTLSLDVLAIAAMEYEVDSDTQQYLLRSAARVASGQSGFAWLNEEGIPVHFCWTTQFDDFWISELGVRMKRPGSGSQVVFDCWTPKAQRGRGFYGRCISAVADSLVNQGLRPWIYSAAMNQSSIQAIERTQFQRRFSIVRRMRFWFSRNDVVENETPACAVPGLVTR